jgi:hypothetical protein
LPGVHYQRLTYGIRGRRPAHRIGRAGAYTPAVETNVLYYGDNLEGPDRRNRHRRQRPKIAARGGRESVGPTGGSFGTDRPILSRDLAQSAQKGPCRKRHNVECSFSAEHIPSLLASREAIR